MAGRIHLHFVFCTKYRLPFLYGEIAEDVAHFLFLKAEELGVEITSFASQPDHVHLMIKMSHTVTPAKVAKHMKGRSSFEVRRRFGWLRQCRAFWQTNYFSCSVGPRSLARVNRYLHSQKGTEQ